MTKAEAKELIKDYLWDMLYGIESDDNLASYLNSPNRAIKFSDDEDDELNYHLLDDDKDN